jgi:hypothetical protein
LEDLGVGGKIILKCILKIGLKGVNLIDLAQDRDKWQHFVNTVMNLIISSKYEEFFEQPRNC